MLGQSWKRVVTYERELGRQGKGIPIPSRQHRHRALKVPYLSQTDKRTIGRWALIAGPIALLMGLSAGFLINQAQVGKPVSIPQLAIPTFDSPKDSMPCARLVAYWRADSDPTIPTSNSTATTTRESHSSSMKTTPATSSSTKPTQTGTSARTTPQSSIQTPRAQSAVPKEPKEIRASATRPPARVSPTKPKEIPPTKQQEKRERIVPSTSTPIKPQQIAPQSIPGPERVAPRQSTTASSPSQEKQAKPPTNGRSTSEVTRPSPKCSP